MDIDGDRYLRWVPELGDGRSHIRNQEADADEERCRHAENYRTIGELWIPNYSGFTSYLGIQGDPLGKTSEQYHVRELVLNDDLANTFRIFYRVKDLAILYEYRHTLYKEYDCTYWTEHLPDGLVEYHGTFTDADFQIPDCPTPVATI